MDDRRCTIDGHRKRRKKENEENKILYRSFGNTRRILSIRKVVLKSIVSIQQQYNFIHQYIYIYVCVYYT